MRQMGSFSPFLSGITPVLNGVNQPQVSPAPAPWARTSGRAWQHALTTWVRGTECYRRAAISSATCLGKAIRAFQGRKLPQARELTSGEL